LLRKCVATNPVLQNRNSGGVILDDERRRYYRLTDLGQRVALAEARRLEQLVHLARVKKLLPGSESMGGA